MDTPLKEVGSLDKILMEGMEFYGYHGVLESERRQGQRFVLDLELELDLSPAGRSDRLEDTLDYADLYRRLKNVLEGERRFSLLEALAEEVLREAMADQRVVGALVRLKKPEAPLEGSFAFMGVELRRERRR